MHFKRGGLLYTVMAYLGVFRSWQDFPIFVSSKEILINSENLETIVPPRASEYYQYPFSLKIADETFNGFRDPETGRQLHGVNVEDLGVLHVVRYLKWNLTVTANHPEFKSLRFLRNLKALHYLEIANTSLHYLDLASLETVRGVVIEHNENLCVNQTKTFWKSMFTRSDGVIRITNNKPGDQCATRCDKECDQDLGCWGPGPGQCRRCQHLTVVDSKTCVSRCDSQTHYEVKERKECRLCDEECAGGCDSFGPTSCNYCKHVRDGEDCVSNCRPTQYVRYRVCTNCRKICPFGCTGPLEHQGPGGCKPCEKTVLKTFFSRDGIFDYYDESELLHIEGTKCLRMNDTCPYKHYQDQVPYDAKGKFALLRGRHVCLECHKFCLKCTGFGLNGNVCQECDLGFNGLIKDCMCPVGTYKTETYHGTCVNCYKYGCKECTATVACVSCFDDRYRVYDQLVPSVNGTFECVSKCPDYQPYLLSNKFYQNYCSSLNLTSLESNEADQSFKYSHLTLPLVLFLIVLIIYLVERYQANFYKTQMKIEQFFEASEESSLSTIETSNRIRLLMVNGCQLKKTSVLWNGTCSTVYKGFLFLDKSKTKVPVAIKVFSNYQAKFVNGFSKEANLLGNLNHPHLLRVVAICMSSNVNMMTQLMPIGDMLHFLRKHTTNPKQNTIIRWSAQIAMAMEYLERNGIVYRELSAKKVLVQNLQLVKVSYFGKDQFLDKSSLSSKIRQCSFKWLALESLKHGMFTHKSDVWSFGVVLWEILTSGEEPYCGTSLPELLQSLEFGERLQQPKSCSAELYSVLATCWTEEVTARPSFQELVDTFTTMLADPTHFVLVSREEQNKVTAEDSALYCDIDYYESSPDYANVTESLDHECNSVALTHSYPVYSNLNHGQGEMYNFDYVNTGID